MNKIADHCPQPLYTQPTSFQKWKKVTLRNLSIGKLSGGSILKLLGQSVVNGACKIFHIKRKPSPDRLLTGTKPVTPSQLSWHLNLGLMRHAFQSAKNLNEQNQVRFLAANYLQKAAPIHLELLKPFSPKFEQFFQISPFSNNFYHRLSSNETLNSPVNQEFAFGKKSPLVLTDTANCGHLFPLKFQVLDAQDSAISLAEELSKVLTSHFSKASFSTPLAASFLFDQSLEFKDIIRTYGTKEKEKEFKVHFERFKKKVNKAVDLTVEKCLASNPHLKKKALKKFVEGNITSICRVQTEKLSGIKLLPLFPKADHKLFLDFIDSTGLYAGFINLNRVMRDAFSIRKDIQYAGKGPTAVYFKDKLDLTELALFKRLTQKFDLPDTKPHVAVLGKSTLKLVSGLLQSINRTQWEEINHNPVKHEILQTSLFKIREQLALAEIWRNDYAKFAQAIELVHAEISTVLEVLSPFKAEDFPSIYLNRLQKIPETLRPFLKAGLCKTGMSVFTGVNAALASLQDNPVRVYSKGCYYELAEFLGYNQTSESVLNDPTVKRVDFYGCQPNPGIEIDSKHTHYALHDAAGDIRKILKEKPDTEHLTVGVDCTIDYFNSQKVYDLLAEFENEIISGKLNFIFFRSGQKFDMLGMDNYYGSPFYMVNNGSSHWKAFDVLMHDEVYKADSLSTQWFCLVNEYASEYLDNYRRLIFQNTREILKNVPEVLKPGAKKNQRIRVNTIDEKIDSCFIDIKLTGRFHRLRGYAILAHFYKKCLEMGIKSHSRASFGFFHPNSTIFLFNAHRDSSTVRINPGLNQDENAVIIDYLKDLIYNA